MQGYPNPLAFTYERCLFYPFEYALQPSPWYKADHIAMKKPELPYWMSELKPYDGPRCYVIPGNHGCCLTQSELFQFIEYLEVPII